jgi:hypothetical protein
MKGLQTLIELGSDASERLIRSEGVRNVCGWRSDAVWRRSVCFMSSSMC